VKEAACGCAGIYTAHAALELYAEAFSAAGALDRLEGFASLHGAAFYGLPPNAETVTLINESWRVPDELPFGGDHALVPFRAGSVVNWRLL
jgi:dihydroorotase